MESSRNTYAKDGWLLLLFSCELGYVAYLFLIGLCPKVEANCQKDIAWGRYFYE